jgi:sortase A
MTTLTLPLPLRGRAAAAALPERPYVVVVSTAVSALVLWFAAFLLVGSAPLHSSSQLSAFDQLRSQLAQGVAPVGTAPLGAPVALLDAPEAGMSHVVVLSGTTARVLQDGPGVRRDTVLPGQQGVSVVYGKATTFGAPFAEIGRLGRGDTITVTSGQGTTSYVVTGQRQAGDPVPAAVASGGGRLTLIAALAQGWRSRLAPNQVLYVDAVAAKAHPAGQRLAGVPAAERAFGTSTAPLVPLVLLLEGLLVVSILAAFAARRWSAWQAWLAAVPVLAALLVACSRQAAALLPNLL